MNVAIVGTGYVGLVTGTCLADFGHTVTCADEADARISALLDGKIPFYEPGLLELVQKNTAAGRLRFTKDLGGAVRDAAVIFLAVGTPEAPNGEADLSQIERVAVEMGTHLTGYQVIVTKSTVPVGTGAWLRDILRRRAGSHATFDVVSNPEFLREGSAVNDFLRPDRVVIGTSSERAAGVMREIYRPLYLIEAPIVITDVESAEMVKYASNAFLAVKIGFMNSIANLCDAVGADVHVVAKGMGLDKRIGSKFLHAGPGYGGSCFPKDTLALARTAQEAGAALRIIETVISVNDARKLGMARKVSQIFDGKVHGKTIAVLGLTFKPNTDDIREAPALSIIAALQDRGAVVRAYDPQGMHEAAKLLDHVTYCEDAYDCAKDADALLIVTEWEQFRALDLQQLKDVMKAPVIIDLRNIYRHDEVAHAGFDYHSIGRP
jgi:UDPglucose 6-dehydrogenase